MSDRQRLFFAVPLADEVRDRLRDKIGNSLDVLRSVRSIPPENWHLTLRFLGATTADQQSRVVESLARTRFPRSFDFRLSGWGAFPRPAAARVLWIGVEDPVQGLTQLHAATEAAAIAAGFQADGRPFSPHLTVGRLRDPANLRPSLDRLPAIEVSCTADRIVLYRSDPAPGGVRYSVETEFDVSG